MRGIVQKSRISKDKPFSTHRTILNMCKPLDDEGERVRFTGWDRGCREWEVGDYVIFIKRDGNETRYKILEVEQCADPKDMYFMTGMFAPRNERQFDKENDK